MTNERMLLSEKEAAGLAGTSLSTLREFSQAGVLHPQTHSGEPRYSLDELEAVFQIEPPKIQKILEGGPASASEKRGAKSSPSSADTGRRDMPKAGDDISTRRPPREPAPEDEEDGQVVAARKAPRESASSPLMGEASSIDLLVENRSLRDQIEMLKEERDWLRRRIEVVEERGERDQMLRMAEHEAMRKLIDQRDQARPRWRFSLPWFGSTEREKR